MKHSTTTDDQLLEFAYSIAKQNRLDHLSVTERLKIITNTPGYSVNSTDEKLKRLFAVNDFLSPSIELNEDEKLMVVKSEKFVNHVTDNFAKSTDKSKGWQAVFKADKPWTSSDIDKGLLECKIDNTPKQIFYSSVMKYVVNNLIPWLVPVNNYSSLYKTSNIGGTFRLTEVFDSVATIIFPQTATMTLLNHFFKKFSTPENPALGENGKKDDATARAALKLTWEYKTTNENTRNTQITPVVRHNGFLTIGFIGAYSDKKENNGDFFLVSFFSNKSNIVGQGVSAHFDEQTWRSLKDQVLDALKQTDSQDVEAAFSFLS